MKSSMLLQHKEIESIKKVIKRGVHCACFHATVTHNADKYGYADDFW